MSHWCKAEGRHATYNCNMMANAHATSLTLSQHVSPNMRETLMTLVRVGASPVDRQGLFAAADIPRGTRIVEYFGEKIGKGESARICGA